MADWELFDGVRTAVRTEADAVEELRRGMWPATTLIREAGSGAAWRHLQTHGPFAMSLTWRPAAPPAPIPVVVSHVVTTRQETSCVTIGCAVVAVFFLLLMLVGAIRSWV